MNGRSAMHMSPRSPSIVSALKTAYARVNTQKR